MPFGDNGIIYRRCSYLRSTMDAIVTISPATMAFFNGGMLLEIAIQTHWHHFRRYHHCCLCPINLRLSDFKFLRSWNPYIAPLAITNYQNGDRIWMAIFKSASSKNAVATTEIVKMASTVGRHWRQSQSPLATMAIGCPIGDRTIVDIGDSLAMFFCLQTFSHFYFGTIW